MTATPDDAVDIDVTIEWSGDEHCVSIPPAATCRRLAGGVAEQLEFPRTSGERWGDSPIVYVLARTDGSLVDSASTIAESGIAERGAAQLTAMLAGEGGEFRLSPEHLREAIRLGKGTYVDRRPSQQVVIQMTTWEYRRWRLRRLLRR